MSIDNISARGKLSSRIENSRTHSSLQRIDSGLNWWAPDLLDRLKSFSPDKILLMGRNANLYGSFIENVGGFKDRVVTTVRTGRPLPLFYRWSISQSALTLVNSYYAKDLLEEGQITANRVEVIHNAYLYNKVTECPLTDHEPNRPFTFLKTAAFVKGKNHNDILRFTQALTTRSDIPFLVQLLREGPEFEKFRKIVNSSDVGHLIEFLGFQSDPYLYMRRADVAISVSLEESLPNAIVESQVNGLPVIAYDTAGTQECMLNKESGFLVEQGDGVLIVH